MMFVIGFRRHIADVQSASNARRGAAWYTDSRSLLNPARAVRASPRVRTSRRARTSSIMPRQQVGDELLHRPSHHFAHIPVALEKSRKESF